jgi:hypothetical protein
MGTPAIAGTPATRGGTHNNRYAQQERIEIDLYTNHIRGAKNYLEANISREGSNTVNTSVEGTLARTETPVTAWTYDQRDASHFRDAKRTPKTPATERTQNQEHQGQQRGRARTQHRRCQQLQGRLKSKYNCKSRDKKTTPYVVILNSCLKRILRIKMFTL